MILKKNISSTKHHIAAEASNGLEAIEFYLHFKPDLVIMDITMSEMNGLDALKEIMKLDPNAKVIMCSAIGQQTVVLEALQSGAKDFIVKPFSSERISEAINNTLK
jgi:two-component system chemotaxis response regulator CheY